jgi:hypothetical protein
MLRKITRKPSPALLIQTAAFTVALAAASLLGWHLKPAETPQSCAKAFTAAERAFVAYENLAFSTQLAATRGRSEFAGHEADKASARGELDDLGHVYRDEKAECAGGVR